MAAANPRPFLLLAQLPPPVHGVTVMTKRVRDVAASDPRWTVEHLWLGGAAGLHDINRRTLRKYVAFATFLAGLLARRWQGRRAAATYLTLAPWTHAVLRDALLACAAKGISERTLVHLHGEGLNAIIDGSSVRASLLRRFLSGTELITCTAKSAETARRAGLFASVTLVPNCVPEPLPAADPAEATPPGRPLRLGYLANLDPRKGALRFVEALAAARRGGVAFEAVIAGPSTPFLTKDALVERIRELGLEDCIRTEDAKYGADKDAYFRALDILLYPSLHDHAPLVVIEALSYGVVPIIMNTGGTGEILGPGLSENVFDTTASIEPFDDFVTRTLRRYAVDRARLIADRAKARARYLETYTEADFVRRCHALLDAQPPAVRQAEVSGHLMP